MEAPATSQVGTAVRNAPTPRVPPPPLAIAPHAARILGPSLAVIAFQWLFIWIPPTLEPQVYLMGLTQGLLVALMATGLTLVRRTNRIINFAQADLGLMPGALAVNLVVLSGVSYAIALVGGLVAALIVGALTELAVMRRFFAAPRLIATVATIGVAQLLALVALWLPAELWDRQPVVEAFERSVFPLDWTLTVGGLPFRGAHLLTWVIAPVAIAVVVAVLRFTDIGIAIRAGAQSSDRALLLGIPVRRMHTYVWSMAAGLSFLSLYLSAGLFGLPVGGALGLTALLGALCAMVLGRMDDLAAVVAASVSVGVLVQAVTWRTHSSVLGAIEVPLGAQAVPAVLGAVIVVTLLVRRDDPTRISVMGRSSWRTAEQSRPVPSEMRLLPEVRVARIGGIATLVGLIIAAPVLLGSTANVSKASALVGFGLVGVSLVILVGWAGQVSLGQLAFAAVGGAVTAKSVLEWQLDPVFALVLAALGGGLSAIVVGLPALRLRGLYLAVVSLAFALAAVGYFLNPTFFDWVPTASMTRRPDALGVFDLDSPGAFYHFCVIVGLVVLAALAGIRRSATGRVMMAVRDNEAAAASYGVSVMRTKLTAFALSGAVAATGGGLLALLQRGYTTTLYAPFDNLVVFSAVVVGGAGSLLGGLLGALLVKGGEWWLPGNWRLLVSGAGMLLVLLVLPGGIAGALGDLRDAVLRAVARRRGILVPSIMADRRTDRSAPADEQCAPRGERIR